MAPEDIVNINNIHPRLPDTRHPDNTNTITGQSQSNPLRLVSNQSIQSQSSPLSHQGKENTPAPHGQSQDQSQGQGQGPIEATGPERTDVSNRSVLETRVSALQTLCLCRTVITTLELTRMRTSRVGYSSWLSFWQQLYDRTLARSLQQVVSLSLWQIDDLFRDVSTKLNRLIAQTEMSIQQALSEREILSLLEDMEVEVDSMRKRRRKKASEFIDEMQVSLSDIHVIVPIELVDQMKRDIFALDPYCDYYPIHHLEGR